MKVFTYSEAQRDFSKLLAVALYEEVEIRHKDGTTFTLSLKQSSGKSPFDVPGIKTEASTDDILDTIKESRESYDAHTSD